MGDQVGDGGSTGPGSSGGGWVLARVSSRCGGGSLDSAAWLVRLMVVLVVAYGGDSFHPMGSTSGKATRGSVSGSVER